MLTLATTVMATVTLGALLPAAVASWTSGAPRAVQPVSVRLDGSLSTAGLPDDASVSRLTLHNDGDGPIRWTVDPDVAAAMPRTITIRDGRVGAEGREGEEFAVVSADGSVPLPPHALAAIPPGSLVRLHEADGRWVLVVEEESP